MQSRALRRGYTSSPFADDRPMQVLLDESRTLFERYRAMFALRNQNTDEAVEV
jgi:hypothetical protein